MRLLLLNVPPILELRPDQSDKEEHGGDNKDHEYGDIVGNVKLDHHVLKVDGVGGREVAGAKACQMVAWAGGVNVGSTWSVCPDEKKLYRGMFKGRVSQKNFFLP